MEQSEIQALQSELQRSKLKTEALLQKVSHLTTGYENQVADLRVDLTILAEEKQSLATELSELRVQLENTKTHAEEAGQDVVSEEANDKSTD